MLKVALTGSVASGKSTVARIWRDEGVPLVSADRLAREVVEPGTPGLDAVVEAFGPGVLREDGSLDRDAVRRRVFQDDAARRRLESILHPRIRSRRDRWMADREREGARLAVAEIPLLFEAELEDDFDVTVVVDAPEEERLRRLVEHRGLDAGEARRIMDAQMAPAAKRRRADHVLVNDGSLGRLERRARALLGRLRARTADAAENEGT